MSYLRKMIIHLFLQQETRKKPVTPVPYNRYDQERFRGKEGMMQSLAFTAYHWFMVELMDSHFSF